MKTLKKGFTLIELMIVVAIIGILAAIAIPNFIKFQARSKQSEVKANLKALYTAEKAYFQEKDTYSALVNTIGFTPERGNRYLYSLATCTDINSRALATATSPAAAVCVGADSFKHGADAPQATDDVGPGAIFDGSVTGGNTGRFTGVGYGNIDNDDDVYDNWSIASESRVSGVVSSLADGASAGTCIEGNNPGGEACNDANDV